ncbi:predicted protein [Nematostella vectensis]|uniref:F5/8 type C domain-containing protein n=1 Tax=Nematostella vectensis TaxID=45351 RepID=A7SG10_NEMVE|nr:predicted protein [Nematostella vectensis]|eukprot:XP_001629441.1 predicted protein [Nematostella vectensis]
MALSPLFVVFCIFLLSYKVQLSQSARAEKECNDPFGLASELPDSKFNSSSELSTSTRPHHGRLHNAHAWCAVVNDADQYLEIALGLVRMIKSIAVQGNPTADQFVTSFALESSVVAESWVPYVETGARRIFQGNSDGGRIMKHSLLHVVTASRMRVRPITWYGHVCLRVELYGCDADPLVPLGMNSGEIPSWAITASSSWYPSGYTGPELHPANYGRLYSSIANTDTCWASSEVDTAPFFQVNLGRLRYVTAIATQRRYGVSQRVTAYNVKYGDCVTWKTIEEDSGQAKAFLLPMFIAEGYIKLKNTPSIRKGALLGAKNEQTSINLVATPSIREGAVLAARNEETNKVKMVATPSNRA